MIIDINIWWVHIHYLITGDAVLKALGEAINAILIVGFTKYVMVEYVYKKIIKILLWRIPPVRKRVTQAEAIRAHHKDGHDAPNPFICEQDACQNLPR